jgi:hypothetical protein
MIDVIDERAVCKMDPPGVRVELDYGFPDGDVGMRPWSVAESWERFTTDGTNDRVDGEGKYVVDDLGGGDRGAYDDDTLRFPS